MSEESKELPPADRIHERPLVFLGCTQEELTAILVGGATGWIPLWLLAAFWIGRVPALGGYCLSASLTILCAARLWRYWKEGKPAGFYSMRLRVWLQEHGILRARLLTRSGRWGLGRSR